MPDTAIQLRLRLRLFVLVVASLEGPLAAQVPVEGVTDKTVYTDRVSFRVPVAGGYTYSVLLDGEPAPAGESVVVDRPDYHELFVERTETATSTKASRTVRFIVRASERGNSEWGLFPWVPYPSIPSATAEFAGAGLVLVVPDRFPTGLEVPVIALVEEGPGDRVGVNGTVRSDEVPGWSVKILRGVGCGSLAPADAAGSLAFTARLASLSAGRTVAFEASPAWTSATGTIGTSVDWGADARVRVTGDLTVPSGVTLAIGAGSVIECGPAAEIHVDGRLVVTGSRERPVTFLPRSRSAPWGGIRFRGSAARGDLTGTILTGAGSDSSWFDDDRNTGDSHRQDEPLIYLNGGSRVSLTDCYIVDNPTGQGGHGEGSYLTMTRCLVERCISAGQYNGGAAVLEDCALIEFPAEDAPFADDDNDGFYLTGGAHSLTDCLLGWALDDALDAGSGSAGSVTVVGCWVESSYHEALAWSFSRTARVSDTVTLNCGQGIESGNGSPDVDAVRCLSTANLVGARLGDNYTSAPNGSLQVLDSLLLFNDRDAWCRAWDTWEEHVSQTDLRNNWLTAADPVFPQNSVWDPAIDAARLRPFLPTAEGEVGMGFAVRSERVTSSQLGEGVPVRLSTFSTGTVRAAYAVESPSGTLSTGSLELVPGETVRKIVVDPATVEEGGSLRIRLHDPAGAELTGISEVVLISDPTVALIAFGATWKYRAGATGLPASWRETGYDDSAWQEGAAELGAGDDDEATTIDIGPSDARYPTVYFRKTFDVADPGDYEALTIQLRRDDGAVVWANGVESARRGMPTGTIQFDTPASETGENELDAIDLSPDVLVAGRNSIAVEVHQVNDTSSDLSFDLALLAARSPFVDDGFIRGDANGDGVLDVSDPVTILLALFLGASVDCDDALDADDSGVVEITDAIHELGFLFLSGSPIPPPYPAAGADPTDGDELGCMR